MKKIYALPFAALAFTAACDDSSKGLLAPEGGPDFHHTGVVITSPSIGVDQVNAVSPHNTRFIWHDYSGSSEDYHLEVECAAGATCATPGTFNKITGTAMSGDMAGHRYIDITLGAGRYTAKIKANITGNGNGQDPWNNYTLLASTFTVGGSGNRDPEGSFSVPASALNEGTSFTFRASVTDPDGDALTYAWTVNGTAVGTNSSTLSHAFGDNSSATLAYSVRLIVTDGRGGVFDVAHTVPVTNVAPTRTNESFAFNNYTGLANASVSFSDAGWLDVVTASFSGITDLTSPANTAGPGTTGPSALTGTFSTSQTFDACVAGAISVTVADDDGGSFTRELAAADNTGGRWSASFLSPIKGGVRNIVKLGNVIPVKVSILDCQGMPVTGRTLSIRVVAGDQSLEAIETGLTEVTPESVSSADTNGVMRWVVDGSHYQYNQATKGLSTGLPYTIVIRDTTPGANQGQIVRTALIEAKK